MHLNKPSKYNDNRTSRLNTAYREYYVQGIWYPGPVHYHSNRGNKKKSPTITWNVLIYHQFKAKGNIKRSLPIHNTIISNKGSPHVHFGTKHRLTLLDQNKLRQKRIEICFSICVMCYQLTEKYRKLSCGRCIYDTIWNSMQAGP